MGSATDAGIVMALREDGRWTYFADSTLGGTNEKGDRFGSAIAGVDNASNLDKSDFLAFGISGENGVGAAKGVIGFPKTTWMQIGARNPGDGYGSAIDTGK